MLGKGNRRTQFFCSDVISYFKTIAVAFLAAFYISGSIQGAIVTTDAQIYAPSETVSIIGSGFQAYEIVGIVVAQDGNSTTAAFTWNVSANSNGAFAETWLVPDGDYLGTTFTITATGQSSGLEATATFMGGNTILEISFDLVQPLCPDTLTSGDIVVVCAKLSQGCSGQNLPLPGREVLFFFSHGTCGANVGQNAFDTATTDANGVACIAVHGADSLFLPNEATSFRVKFLGEDKPGPSDPPNSACDPDERVHLSVSNDCLVVPTTEDCQGWLTFDQRELFAVDVFSMKTADINRDNFIDIVFCGTDATPGLFVFLAINANDFSDPTSCLDIYNAALDVGFINADSLPDIVATTADSIFILLNSGQSISCDSWTIVRFSNPDKSIAGQSRLSGSGIPSVISDYFNDDSNLDLFVGPSSIYFGDGTGNFSSSSSIPVLSLSAAAADFDRNGSTDLLVVGNDSAYILLNDGIGNFSPSVSLFVDTGYVSISVDHAVGDFDGDCNFDFLVTIPNVDSTELSVLNLGWGDGLGNLEQAGSIVINGVVEDVLVIDVDRDSTLDIIVSNGTAQRVEIYLGNGDRTFELLEFLSIDLAGDSPFSLATADFDRDGQPDFISGSNVNGNLLLSTNNLADLPVLPDEMVVTALTNTTMKITNPLGYQTSEESQTIAGGDIWSIDVNGDGSLDEQVIDYNLLLGEYEMTFSLEPEFDDGSTTQPLTSAVRIDGSQQATIFDSYTFGSSKSQGNRAEGCLPTSITFTYLVGEDSALYYPFNGIQTNSSQPTFFWGGLLPDKSQSINRFHLQVDSRLEFLDPVIDDSNLTTGSFMPCTTLFEIGEVYYWHVRWHDGVSWSEFSNTFALYVGGNCCVGIKGDVNGDGKNANIIDLTYIVDFIFRGGDCISCADEADMTGEGDFNVVDLTFLVDYIFRSGLAPGACY